MQLLNTPISSILILLFEHPHTLESLLILHHVHILTRSLRNLKYSTYLMFISTKFLALFSFRCRSSCPLLFHLFSFLTLIVINISPGKKTTYIFILTNILFLFGYRVLKFGMTFLSHFVIHLLFLVININ